MPRKAIPSARSRQLAMELRKLREAAGLTRAQVARHLGVSSSKVRRAEIAESGIYFDDLHKLLDLYQVDDRRKSQLLELAQRSWLRTGSSENFPEDWRMWIDFEADARAIYNYQPCMLPGLLQTPEYAKAVIKVTGVDRSNADIDRLVDNRMKRRRLLYKPNGVKFHAIIEEGVLTCQFGDTNDLIHQLRHLLDVAKRPNITLQILLTEIGLHPGLSGSFVVLNYDNKPSLVWLENKTSSIFIEDEDEIQVYTKTWAVLQKLAQSPEESIRVITAAVDTLLCDER